MNDQRGKIMQLQQDRIMGNYETTSYENEVAGMRAIDAANWRQPPLPPSPCIKIKATGEIHEWAPFFASRPDLCENCDEHGNTDPAAWQGRKSPHFEDNIHKQGMPMAPMDTSAEEKKEVKQQPEPANGPRPPLATPPGLLFNVNEFSSGLLDNDVPQVGSAHLVLGVPQEHAKDYSQLGTIRAAMPISQTGGVPVGEAIKSSFDNTM